MTKREPKRFKVATTSEMLTLMFQDVAQEGDICECTESDGVFIFKSGGWTRVKLNSPGFNHIYGDNTEH